MTIQLKKELLMRDVEGIIVGLDEQLNLDNRSTNFSNAVSLLKSRELFEGKIGQVQNFTLVDNDEMKEVYVIGLGTDESFTKNKLRKAISVAFKGLKAKKVKALALDLTQIKTVFNHENQLSRLVSETLVLANYTFDVYKSDAKASSIEKVDVVCDSLNERAFNEGLVLGESTAYARFLTNMPANIMTPSKLADLAKEEGLSQGFETEIKSLDEIKALEMHAFLTVARASSEEPKLIVMRYNGNPESDQRLGLVGKGLTYDSGGLSIKPTPGMVTMKCDMGGASAVIGAMRAIAKQQLKVNVTAVIAACENMISGSSYKPGDIIQSMGGKSIFIGNTDAEGRLTLVDAVTYIQNEEKVTQIVDIATLTGAAIHCLGHHATPFISNNDALASRVENAFSKSDENAWRMPILDDFKDLIKHEYADLTNTAGAPGTITAGMFIGAFVNDLPWVHIDIAGTAFIEKAEGIFSKGGTGVGVRPLYFLAKKMGK